MKKLVLLLPALLTGCAAFGGGADYHYSHTDKDGASCEIVVGSTRSLQGVGVEITENCQLKAVADQATANEILAKALADLVSKLPQLPAASNTTP